MNSLYWQVFSHHIRPWRYSWLNKGCYCLVVPQVNPLHCSVCPNAQYQITKFPKATFIESTISIRFVLSYFQENRAIPWKCRILSIFAAYRLVLMIFKQKRTYVHFRSIFKFYHLFYKQVALLISYCSAQELARTFCRIEISDRLLWVSIDITWKCLFFDETRKVG